MAVDPMCTKLTDARTPDQIAARCAEREADPADERSAFSKAGVDGAGQKRGA